MALSFESAMPPAKEALNKTQSPFALMPVLSLSKGIKRRTVTMKIKALPVHTSIPQYERVLVQSFLIIAPFAVRTVNYLSITAPVLPVADPQTIAGNRFYSPLRPD